MGCSFYIGNFKKCNSGFAIFSWVTTILGLFAPVTPKSVHESVWWLCEWAGIRFCLKTSLLRAGPLLVGLSFSNLHQLCDSVLLFNEHMAELSTYIGTNVVRLPTLGWIGISNFSSSSRNLPGTGSQFWNRLVPNDMVLSGTRVKVTVPKRERTWTWTNVLKMNNTWPRWTLTFIQTSGCPWPSATVKSPGFFKLD